MTARRRLILPYLALLMVVLVVSAPLTALGRTTPAAPQLATPEPAAKSIVWDGVDVTVELREDSSMGITETDRVIFSGGMFSRGYREIPLAQVESVDNISVGEIVDGKLVPYRQVSTSDFSSATANTFTYQDQGDVVRIDWSFSPTRSQTRTFQLEYVAHGALRVYDEPGSARQEIAWIGVGRELTAGAPVNHARLTFILPRPVDPATTVLQGPGGFNPQDHSSDGRTWVWEASDLGPGDSLIARLRFAPLVPATKPAWQAAGEAHAPQPTEQPGSSAPPAAATPVASPGAASEAQVLTTSYLEAGRLDAGEAALAELVAREPANADAQFGLGVIRFFQAVERLSRGLYRYGLQPPQSFMAPVLRMPVPENPHPQPITYDDFRQLLQGYVTDLASAEATLAAVGDRDVELVLDFRKIRYDSDGDGTASGDERLTAVIARVTLTPEDELPSALTFAFDTGDVYWLRAYCHVMMAFGEFFLAYDWHESFDVSFFHFFPAMESPFRDALDQSGGSMSAEFGSVADLISFLHIRWPLHEPVRLSDARGHLKQAIALSRQSWQAIEEETDDDREWIPNAHQTNPFLVVDAKRITAWMQVLDEADAILDGEKLVPHWRFQQGFNLRRVFEEPQDFDLVLWMTGPAALPYLEEGPVSTPEEWAHMIEAFEGSFGLFALWVN